MAYRHALTESSTKKDVADRVANGKIHSWRVLPVGDEGPIRNDDDGNGPTDANKGSDELSDAEYRKSSENSWFPSMRAID